MEYANSIRVANIQIARANEEVPWALPKGCRWFTLQTRSGAALRLAYEAGLVKNSQPPYFTLKADNQWDEKQFEVESQHGIQLYFASDNAGEVVEVLMGVYDPEMGGFE